MVVGGRGVVGGGGGGGGGGINHSYKAGHKVQQYALDLHMFSNTIPCLGLP